MPALPPNRQWSALMRTIEIRVPSARLADTLNAMREWLDREKCYLSRFRYESGNDGTAVISVSFSNNDDPRLDEFHQQFNHAS
jgi:hypothetical protein